MTNRKTDHRKRKPGPQTSSWGRQNQSVSESDDDEEAEDASDEEDSEDEAEEDDYDYEDEPYVVSFRGAEFAHVFWYVLALSIPLQCAPETQCLTLLLECLSLCVCVYHCVCLGRCGSPANCAVNSDGQPNDFKGLVGLR